MDAASIFPSLAHFMLSQEVLEGSFGAVSIGRLAKLSWAEHTSLGMFGAR